MVAQQEGIEAEVLADMDGVRTLSQRRATANRWHAARAEMGQWRDNGGEGLLEPEWTRRNSRVVQCSRVGRRGWGRKPVLERCSRQTKNFMSASGSSTTSCGGSCSSTWPAQ
jgi:hypothetical protein